MSGCAYLKWQPSPFVQGILEYLKVYRTHRKRPMDLTSPHLYVAVKVYHSALFLAFPANHLDVLLTQILMGISFDKETCLHLPNFDQLPRKQINRQRGGKTQASYTHHTLVFFLWLQYGRNHLCLMIIIMQITDDDIWFYIQVILPLMYCTQITLFRHLRKGDIVLGWVDTQGTSI